MAKTWPWGMMITRVFRLLYLILIRLGSRPVR
jgi:hypothetical protein